MKPSFFCTLYSGARNFWWQGGRGDRLRKFASVLVTSQCLFNFRLARALVTSQDLGCGHWRRFPCAASLSIYYPWSDGVLVSEGGSDCPPLPPPKAGSLPPNRQSRRHTTGLYGLLRKELCVSPRDVTMSLFIQTS